MSTKNEVFQDELNTEVNLAVQGKLADFNITEAHLAALRDELLPLAEVPIADEARYKLVKGGLRKINSTLGIIERICTVGRRPALLEQRAWITAQKEYTATGEEIRNPLKARIDEWEAIAAAKEAEEVLRWTAKMNARKERMATIGFRFNPLTKEYELPGFASIDEEGVTGLNVDDLQFAEWLLGLEQEVAEHKEREEEKQRTAKIAADALAKEQWAKDLAAKMEAERIAAAQAEIERRQKAVEDKEREMALRILKARNIELMAVGAVEYPDGAIGFGAYTKTQPELVAMSEDDFTAFVAETKNRRTTWDEEKKRIAAEKEAERAAREKQLQDEAAKKAVEDERIRVAAETKERLEKETREAQQEAERILKLDDKEKVKAFGQKLGLLIAEIPELKSTTGTTAMGAVGKQISDLVVVLSEIEL